MEQKLNLTEEIKHIGQKRKSKLRDRYRTLLKRSDDIFEKAHNFTEAEGLRKLNIYPYFQIIENNEGPMAEIEGRQCVMLGSNNYLGLTIHPEVRQAAVNAIRDFGTSLTGSRLLNGTHPLHIELEEALATFLKRGSCAVFSTGYQANLGVLSALVGRHDSLLLDDGNHASVFDGASLARGNIFRFEHGNMSDLARVIGKLPDKGGRLLVVDGIFSMEGEVAPLPAIMALAKKHRIRVVVDDAHSIGMLGAGGEGSITHHACGDDVALIVGTFSKSLASVGGFVAGDFKVIDFIKHFARPMLFSASLPPASAAAALAALKILQREPERVARLNENARYWRNGLQHLGFDTGLSTTAIVPILIGDEMKTFEMWRKLLDLGIYTNAVLFPAVPPERSMLRTSCTSEHRRDHLDRALEAMNKCRISSTR